MWRYAGPYMPWHASQFSPSTMCNLRTQHRSSTEFGDKHLYYLTCLPHSVLRTTRLKVLSVFLGQSLPKNILIRLTSQKASETIEQNNTIGIGMQLSHTVSAQQAGSPDSIPSTTTITTNNTIHFSVKMSPWHLKEEVYGQDVPQKLSELLKIYSQDCDDRGVCCL